MNGTCNFHCIPLWFFTTRFYERRMKRFESPFVWKGKLPFFCWSNPNLRMDLPFQSNKFSIPNLGFREVSKCFCNRSKDLFPGKGRLLVFHGNPAFLFVVMPAFSLRSITSLLKSNRVYRMFRWMKHICSTSLCLGLQDLTFGWVTLLYLCLSMKYNLLFG